MIDFVFRDHFRLATHAALLFAVGLFISWPVVHYRIDAAARYPLAVFRLVMRLLGPAPSLARMATVIFCFNSAVMFIYMAGGFHPMLPKALCIWTGMNVGIIIGLAHRGDEVPEPAGLASGHWRPPQGLAVACGLLVLVAELSCFWFAIAMGIRMGNLVQLGRAGYLDALAPRARAFACLILPVLLLSAAAEAVAVRGAAVPDDAGN